RRGNRSHLRAVATRAPHGRTTAGPHRRTTTSATGGQGPSGAPTADTAATQRTGREASRVPRAGRRTVMNNTPNPDGTSRARTYIGWQPEKVAFMFGLSGRRAALLVAAVLTGVWPLAMSNMSLGVV